MAGGQAVCADLGISDDDAAPAFRALDDAGYISAYFGASGFPMHIQATEKGLQHCSGWPSGDSSSAFIDALLRAVSERADDPATPDEERGRLRGFLGAAGSVGKDVLTDIASKVIEHQAGI